MFRVFCDGSKIYKKFLKKYKVHKKGFFILAPSGTGKTYFVNNQKIKDWVDGDDLWTATGAQPLNDWWAQGLDVISEVDQRCDVITKQAVDLGFWIIGASQYWYIPDAIVIPDWETHKKYIRNRESGDYDGGAKSEDFDQVLGHIKYLRELAKKNKVKVFKSIDLAVEYLKKSL